MRKLILSTLLLAVISVTAFSQKAESQKPEYRSTVSIGAGPSIIGKVGGLLNKIEIPDSAATMSFDAKLVYGITYDYRIFKWFSVGAAFSIQKMGGTFYDFHYKDFDDVLKYINVNYDVTRLNFAVRPLFHYGNSPKLDMYSGFRMGMLSSSVALNAEVPGLVKQDIFKFGLGRRVCFQMVGFGIKYYITKNIGINTEIAIGAPYFLSGGLNVRF
jgi:hypothetical protein